MVKLDPNRDYYADLELPPTADVSDVKKQFRKLALKYHPDRNPGREADVNAQFQTIQSAHEVLVDPVQKAKYDATRVRSHSQYPRASGVRGNPWQNAGDAFPPPPRRAPAGRNPTAQSGAFKYRDFPPNVPPAAKSPARDDPSEARRKAWEAWEQMRPSTQQKASRPQQPSTSKADGKETKPPGSQSSSRPVPQTPSQKQRQEASFGNRKSGYYPRSPAPGDEPPVTSKNYATSRNTSNLFSQTAASTRRRRASSSADPSDPNVLDPRQSTPYQGVSGEKTNPFDGVPLSRARSMRVPESESEESAHRSSSDDEPRRSSSVPRKAPKGRSGRWHIPRESEQRPSTAADPSAAAPRGQYPSNSRDSARYKRNDRGSDPRTEAARAVQSDHPEAGLKSTGSTSADPANETRPMYNPSFRFSPADATAKPAPTQPRFNSNSSDAIHTKFVRDGDPNPFQFSAGGDGPDHMGKPRSKSSSRTGRQTPGKGKYGRPGKVSTEEQAATEQAKGVFNPTQWAEIGPQNFAPQPARNAATVSPSRLTRLNSKKAKSVKATMGTAGMVAEDTTSSEEDALSGQREENLPESPNAMDIDTPPPQQSANGKQRENARTIPVEPSKPEWRTGDGRGRNGEEAKAPDQPNPPKHAAGSEDTREFHANLADFRSVPPFAPETSGLGSFGDMKSTLPFDSRAADRVSMRLGKFRMPLTFPKIPQAPVLPKDIWNKPGAGGSGQEYIRRFHEYLHDWDAFNAQVVAIFNSRQSSSILHHRSKDCTAASLADELLCLQEDQEARRKWTLACEEHEGRIRDLMAAKAKLS